MQQLLPQGDPMADPGGVGALGEGLAMIGEEQDQRVVVAPRRPQAPEQAIDVI